MLFNGRVLQKNCGCRWYFSSVLVAHGHAQTKIFKCHRVLIGASSSVARTIVKDQAVLHHSKRPGQGNSTLHGTGGPQQTAPYEMEAMHLECSYHVYKGQRETERSHFQLFHIISNIHNQTWTWWPSLHTWKNRARQCERRCMLLTGHTWQGPGPEYQGGLRRW